MKPTSIVFLVVAAILLIGGMITCTVARSIADTDGYLLFTTTEDGGTYRRESFSEQPITKIELTLKDAQIHVYGGSAESYMEIVNFRDGMYTFSTAGKIVTLDELVDVGSFFDLTKGFSFKGIRYLLNTREPEGVRRVNVYLDDTAIESLKVLSVTGDNCTVHMENLPAVCDITVNASSSLTMTAYNLQTNSAMTLTSPVCDLTIKDTSLNAFTMDATHGYLTAEDLFFKSLNIEAEDGDIDITAPITLAEYDVEIGAGNGKVNVGGMDRIRPYSAKATAETKIGTIKFASENADFALHTIVSPIID